MQSLFASGPTYTYRLEVGNEDNWLTGVRAHFTVWRQDHDPFTETTDGSDYMFVSGEESSTCGGFNGLHDKVQQHSMTSDADANDDASCWWMQIVPTANYDGQGYLEGYGGTLNYHQWQTLWVK